jgi:hypothetical protein
MGGQKTMADMVAQYLEEYFEERRPSIEYWEREDEPEITFTRKDWDVFICQVREHVAKKDRWAEILKQVEEVKTKKTGEVIWIPVFAEMDGGSKV